MGGRGDTGICQVANRRDLSCLRAERWSDTAGRAYNAGAMTFQTTPDKALPTRVLVVPALAAAVLLLVGGCPTPQTDSISGGSAVHAVLAYSVSSGNAPLSVVLSAADSTSSNAGDLTYAWDLADGTASEDAQVLHTYAHAGLYTVKLQVTDATGAVGMAVLDVQVRGSGAIAIIGADTNSGPQPLTVQFDGTQSVATDDTIRDYFWDFGDGAKSQLAKPLHTFMLEGTYTVQLRVVTAGGVEAKTTTQITVGVRNASLQFDGTSYATLLLDGTQNLKSWTFEAWIKAQADGGTLAALGSAFSVEVAPSSNLIRTRVAGTQTDFTAAALANTWRHIAVTFSASSATDPNQPTSGVGLCTVYLDGAPLGSQSGIGTITADRITLGNGLRGKVSEVRLWSVARTQTQIAALKGVRVIMFQTGLVGAWPLDEGAGQTVYNVVSPPNGMLGASSGADVADPAWSTDGPPL